MALAFLRLEHGRGVRQCAVQVLLDLGRAGAAVLGVADAQPIIKVDGEAFFEVLGACGG